MTLFDAEIMLKLAQESVRESRAALVAAYNKQIESERSLETAFTYLRDLNASAA